MKDLKKIKIYTKDYCPYCIRLKKYLSQNGYEFENISVDNDIELYKELKARTNHHTVPQVFVGDEFIGGSEDFFAFIEQ